MDKVVGDGLRFLICVLVVALCFAFPLVFMGWSTLTTPFSPLVDILGVLEACCGLLLPSCWATGSGLIPCFKCARFTDRVSVFFVGYAMMRYAILACFPAPCSRFWLLSVFLVLRFSSRRRSGLVLLHLVFGLSVDSTPFPPFDLLSLLHWTSFSDAAWLGSWVESIRGIHSVGQYNKHVTL